MVIVVFADMFVIQSWFRVGMVIVAVVFAFTGWRRGLIRGHITVRIRIGWCEVSSGYSPSGSGGSVKGVVAVIGIYRSRMFT